ncbi:MAG: DUF4956 domain-containing protein [Calditrichaeota bacterium]|nr:DUF4956 domain-containing protein [Calditrichota bacterium]
MNQPLNLTWDNTPFQQFTLIEIPLNLGMALIIGILIAVVYRMTTRNTAISQSFLVTIVMLSMVAALVMMVVGNSLIRAFSLIGALSIIRFRTVVKENRDIAFIFFALGAGMASGIGNYPLALYGSATILIFLLILDFIRFGAPISRVYLLRFLLTASTDMPIFLPIFDRHLSSYSQLSAKSARMGQFVEYSYIVRGKRKFNEQAFLNALGTVQGIEKITLSADESEAEL